MGSIANDIRNVKKLLPESLKLCKCTLLGGLATFTKVLGVAVSAADLP